MKELFKKAKVDSIISFQKVNQVGKNLKSDNSENYWIEWNTTKYTARIRM